MKDYPMVVVVQGDITDQSVEVIVNAANPSLQRGGGVDGAIHRAAGPALQQELNQIGYCPTGECCLTQAYNLKAKAIIHCVGPVWSGGQAMEDQLLASCYHRALTLAREHDLRTIAFPSISTGIYDFPRKRAAEIAIKTICQFLDSSSPGSSVSEVKLVCFDSETAQIYQELLCSENRR